MDSNAIPWQDKKRREREEEERLSLQPRRSLAEASSMDSEMPASPHSRKLRAPGSSPPPAYVPSPSGHPMQNGEPFLGTLHKSKISKVFYFKKGFPSCKRDSA